MYDQDKNGFLTLKEFRIFLRDNIADDLTEREVRNFRKSLDDNGSNKIELQEVIALYK